MDRNTVEKVFYRPIGAATIALVGWSLVNIIELKEDIAIVRTDIKHIVKAVDHNSELISKLSEQIASLSPGHPFIVTQQSKQFTNPDLIKTARFERNWENETE